jgi:predicted Zn-dependent protease
MNQLAEDDYSRVMEVIRQAVELGQQNDTAFATQIMEAVVEEFPGLAIGHSYLGWILSRTGRHREAIEQSRVAVQMEPASERISLLLFRALWGAGERNEALHEMNRFTAIGHSDEYSKMMEEWEKIAEA